MRGKAGAEHICIELGYERLYLAELVKMIPILTYESFVKEINFLSQQRECQHAIKTIQITTNWLFPTYSSTFFSFREPFLNHTYRPESTQCILA